MTRQTLTAATTTGILLLTLLGCQQQRPKPKPAVTVKTPRVAPTTVTTAPAYRVYDMRVQTSPAQSYFYTSTRATFRDIMTPISKAMAGIERAANEGHVVIKGPPTFVYLGATEDPDKPFELQVGVPVAKGTAAWGEFKVRDLPPFHNASAIFLGSVENLGKAYDKLIPDMIAAGLTPSNETREIYLLWESPQSNKNIILVEVGIAGP